MFDKDLTALDVVIVLLTRWWVWVLVGGVIWLLTH